MRYNSVIYWIQGKQNYVTRTVNGLHVENPNRSDDGIMRMRINERKQHKIHVVLQIRLIGIYDSVNIRPHIPDTNGPIQAAIVLHRCNGIS